MDHEASKERIVSGDLVAFDKLQPFLNEPLDQMQLTGQGPNPHHLRLRGLTFVATRAITPFTAWDLTIARYGIFGPVRRWLFRGRTNRNCRKNQPCTFGFRQKLSASIAEHRVNAAGLAAPSTHTRHLVQRRAVSLAVLPAWVWTAKAILVICKACCIRKTSPKHHRRHSGPLKVKKVQRSFAVEYRSGRRKPNSKPNSIWGDMDIKSVAQDLQDEAAPFLPVGRENNEPGSEVSSLGEEQAAALLTPPIEHKTNASASQETIMADDNNTMTDADTPAVAAPDVAKKERKPRAKKAARETVSAAVSAQLAAASNAAAGKPKRGRKAKSDEGAPSAQRAPAKRGLKAAQAATVPSVAAVDEFADLLQLEEENQRLRKQLAEKLRAENADLRKRLNLG